MTVKMIKTEYGTSKHILAIPDHYATLAIKIPKASAAGGIVTKVGDRFIVKAGTVYPSNDAKAEGLIFQDYDVTDGDVTAALLVHGFVRGDRLPAQLGELVKLPLIHVVKAIE